MELDTYVQQVQEQLVAAAALGDDRVRDIAATLAGAASPAVRLAVLNALAVAADEITAALLDSPGAPAVAVHLDSDGIRIAVTGGPTASAQPARPDEGDASARVSLRLSEALKADIEAAANQAAISVNSWLIRAATSVLASEPGQPPGGGGAGEHHFGSAQRVTGWVTG